MTDSRPIVPAPRSLNEDSGRSHTELGKSIRESTIVNQISARPEPITSIPGITSAPSSDAPASPPTSSGAEE